MAPHEATRKASRTEFQTANERLTALNREGRERVAELSRANAAFDSLVATAEIGTLLLDCQLTLMHF